MTKEDVSAVLTSVLTATKIACLIVVTAAVSVTFLHVNKIAKKVGADFDGVGTDVKNLCSQVSRNLGEISVSNEKLFPVLQRGIAQWNNITKPASDNARDRHMGTLVSIVRNPPEGVPEEGISEEDYEQIRRETSWLGFLQWLFPALFSG